MIATQITRSDLTAAIQKAAEDWVYDISDPICYMDINSGSCGEFAHYVLSALPKDCGVTLAHTDMFMKQIGLEHFQSDDIALSRIRFSNHVWLMLEERHFDIERPQGIGSFIELPYFQREIEILRMGMTEIEFSDFLVARNHHLDSKLRFIG